MAFDLQPVEIDILRALLKKQGGGCIRRRTTRKAYGPVRKPIMTMFRTRHRRPPRRLFIHERTIRDFNVRNQHPVFLPPEVLPDEDSLFLDQIPEPSSFHELTLLSRPGMDRSRTEALVYLEWCCMGEGYGHYYLLRWQHGRWMRVMMEIDFIG